MRVADVRPPIGAEFDGPAAQVEEPMPDVEAELRATVKALCAVHSKMLAIIAGEHEGSLLLDPKDVFAIKDAALKGATLLDQEHRRAREAREKALLEAAKVADKYYIEIAHRIRALSAIGASGEPHGIEEKWLETARAQHAEISAAENEFLGALKASDEGWRPIESAPEDGTAVLLGWSDGTPDPIGVGRWHDAELGEWISDEASSFTSQPTHWQPLPPPPASDGKPEVGT